MTWLGFRGEKCLTPGPGRPIRLRRHGRNQQVLRSVWLRIPGCFAFICEDARSSDAFILYVKMRVVGTGCRDLRSLHLNSLHKPMLVWQTELPDATRCYQMDTFPTRICVCVCICVCSWTLWVHELPHHWMLSPRMCVWLWLSMCMCVFVCVFVCAWVFLSLRVCSASVYDGPSGFAGNSPNPPFLLTIFHP